MYLHLPNCAFATIISGSNCKKKLTLSLASRGKCNDNIPQLRRNKRLRTHSIATNSRRRSRACELVCSFHRPKNFTHRPRSIFLVAAPFLQDPPTYIADRPLSFAHLPLRFDLRFSMRHKTNDWRTLLASIDSANARAMLNILHSSNPRRVVEVRYKRRLLVNSFHPVHICISAVWA